MPADVNGDIYLRKRGIGCHCQPRPGLVFAMTGSEMLLSLGYEHCFLHPACPASFTVRLLSKGHGWRVT
jgi:hypothetical protein